MKTWTESLVSGEPRTTTIVRIGDKVNDLYGFTGVFTIEEIDDNGNVWGSDMKVPYDNHNNKNFIDGTSTYKVNEQDKKTNSV
jgi:hypothetical protein